VISIVVEEGETSVIERIEQEKFVGEGVGDESLTEVEFGYAVGDCLGGHGVGMV
jgi:hypothetical protein